MQHSFEGLIHLSSTDAKDAEDLHDNESIDRDEVKEAAETVLDDTASIQLSEEPIKATRQAFHHVWDEFHSTVDTSSEIRESALSLHNTIQCIKCCKSIFCCFLYCPIKFFIFNFLKMLSAFITRSNALRVARASSAVFSTARLSSSYSTF